MAIWLVGLHCTAVLVLERAFHGTLEQRTAFVYTATHFRQRRLFVARI